VHDAVFNPSGTGVAFVGHDSSIHFAGIPTEVSTCDDDIVPFKPDIEDVQAVAISILRHRIIKNYKAEADGISVETIIESLF
jgi:hypothetical protein